MQKVNQLIDAILLDPKRLKITRFIVFALIGLFTLNMWYNRVGLKYIDFRIFLTAATNAVNGNDIYAWQISEGQYYVYLPLFCILLIPLTYLPYQLDLLVWSFASIFCVGWVISTFYRVMSGVRMKDLDIKTRWAICYFSLVPTVIFISDNPRHGQPDIFLLAIAVYGVSLFERGRQGEGGFVLGLGAVLKIFSGAVLPVYLVQKKLKILLGAAIGTFVGLMLPALFVGFERNIGYIRFWIENVVLHDDPRTNPVHFMANGSLQALIFRLFSDVPAFEYNGDLFVLTVVVLPDNFLQVMGRLVFAALLLMVCFYTFRYRNSNKFVSQGGAIAVSMAIAPLLTGVAEKHHFVFLLPAYIFVVHTWIVIGLKSKLFRGLVLASFVCGTLTSSSFIGVYLNHLSNGLCINSISALLLIGSIFCVAEHFRKQTGDHPPATVKITTNSA